MKAINLIIIIIIFSNTIVGQDIQRLNDYKEYKSIGDIENGQEVGEWISLSIDSIIYRKGSYDSRGIPIGIWSVYFPNGDLRKTTEYKNGKVINWTCYSNNNKIIEISNTEAIDYDTYKEILIKETEAMELNDNPYRHTVAKRDDFCMVYVTYDLYLNHLNRLNYELIRLLRHIGYSGTFKKWNHDNNLVSYHTFSDGIDNETKYIYKKGRLKYQKELRNDIVLKVIMYKKDGSIKMVLDK